MKKGVTYLVFSLSFFIASYGFSEVSETRLQESYHRFESSYQISQVESVRTSQKSTLHSLLLTGEFSLTPEVSFLTTLPFITLSNHISVANPYLGIQGTIFEGLIKDFPTFVFFNGGVRPPLGDSQEFIFKRTDVLLGFSTLREIQHLNLHTDLSYIVKIDSSSHTKRYGNEWSLMLGGELSTGYQFSPGIFLNYRRAGKYEDLSPETSQTISGKSLFLIRPAFSYYYAPDMTFSGALIIPLGRQGLKDSLKTFGDYTIAGVGGNTFFLNFEKKF